MAIGIAEVQIYIFFHLPRDHVIKRSCDFKGGRCKALHLSRDHVIKRSHNLVDAVTHTMSPFFVRKMQYFQSQYQFQFQCLQITNTQTEQCAFESCSFCKSIQNKNQISISKFAFR